MHKLTTALLVVLAIFKYTEQSSFVKLPSETEECVYTQSHMDAEREYWERILEYELGYRVKEHGRCKKSLTRLSSGCPQETACETRINAAVEEITSLLRSQLQTCQEECVAAQGLIFTKADESQKTDNLVNKSTTPLSKTATTTGYTHSFFVRDMTEKSFNTSNFSITVESTKSVTNKSAFTDSRSKSTSPKPTTTGLKTTTSGFKSTTTGSKSTTGFKHITNGSKSKTIGSKSPTTVSKQPTTTSFKPTTTGSKQITGSKPATTVSKPATIGSKPATTGSKQTPIVSKEENFMPILLVSNSSEELYNPLAFKTTSSESAAINESTTASTTINESNTTSTSINDSTSNTSTTINETTSTTSTAINESNITSTSINEPTSNTSTTINESTSTISTEINESINESTTTPTSTDYEEYFDTEVSMST